MAGSSVPQFTSILFKLPDGRFIMQRRTKNAPYAPGKLGAFGGWVEEGETPYECLLREIKEETSLDVDKLQIKQVTDFIIQATQDFDKDRHFFLYEAEVGDLSFEIYEGDGAEAYTSQKLKQRTDLTSSAKYVFTNIDLSQL